MKDAQNKLEIHAVGEIILILYSKQDWINRSPRDLPQKKPGETRLWIDSNGFSLSTGLDFSHTEEQNGFPVRVISFCRSSEIEI